MKGHNIMADLQTIAVTTMAERVQAGNALPLLPEGVPGPVQYASQWWAVLADETVYRQITDPDQIRMLDRNARRYAAARTTTARHRGGGQP